MCMWLRGSMSMSVSLNFWGIPARRTSRRSLPTPPSAAAATTTMPVPNRLLWRRRRLQFYSPSPTSTATSLPTTRPMLLFVTPFVLRTVSILPPTTTTTTTTTILTIPLPASRINPSSMSIPIAASINAPRITQ
ncbi:hypothetical protein JAAARDRAFT_234638 [Jaapia argillacea MUCL 33604]|uniref:Uncharacterized protein n=1 Tax=Jaapia argillacea MUCL 33604 TaxID=933084 RepID=A0A067QMB8_9AGAM|nr:hypothetical protein JAAARDRAFT_234638 [Jaapia argillacea MUCL 33604]